MAVAQARLDEFTAKIEALKTRLEEINESTSATKARIQELREQNAKLEAVVVARARELYMSGRSDMLEALFGADSMADLSEAAEMLSTVSLDDSGAFVKLARARAELIQLEEELSKHEEEVRSAYEDVLAESKKQQALFDSIAADYESLQDRIAPSGVSAARVRAVGGMACPVAGPVSFTDTWGAPRAGHTHQGVDMMAAYGTPVVAIVSGTITYAAYDGSGGNMIFLSGDDGNQYWYMHNQQNLVSGGHVTVGQQIATVGDTGNAAGTPHVHFEYHPGGGAAVNPTPLVASIC